ncbi:MAG TPA: aminotransferase class I/II-fold pyridoxal phosphate-dependent enzyme, partial [Vicinamibacterales bacterium]|nr:aminotransferase class I/II-fold pyridoxal phosphate-dependent enzyme [Vicinamibacterales bacterium]
GLDDLARQLQAREEWPNALVIIDGVFSMTGREADLRGIAALKQRYRFRLYVDDAHGIGVLGPGGRGTAAAQGVTDDVDVLFGTFSKSFASLGGFVAADAAVINYLRYRTRTQIFSAALPPASAAAALASLRVLRRDGVLLERLWDNVTYFRDGVQRLGYQTMGSTTPIVPLFVGSETLAFTLCLEAEAMGLFVTPAVYPAVPAGHALIRTSVTPAHSRDHLDTALGVLADLAKRHAIPNVDPATIPPAREMDFQAALKAREAGQA